jgi:peptide/nickel transport system substrate-binding protein
MPSRALEMLAFALLCSSSLLAQQPSPKAILGDPRLGEVHLETRGDWNATLLHQGEAGVWCVKALTVFPQYGCPEVVGLDDKGRLLVFTSYSGKWTPAESVKDGTWLGGIAQVDLDPTVPGTELYTGGNGGNLYRVITRNEPRGASRLESLEIGHIPADDVHTMVGGELLPSRPGSELLAFTGSGKLYAIEHRGAAEEDGAAAFALRRLAELPGRVRDAVILPARAGEAPWIACVSRSQEIFLVRLTTTGLEQRPISSEGMGTGRIALRTRDPRRPDEPFVLYATRDEGVILRFEGTPESGWKREIIYAGPQGPRGIAAGRFDADPAVETVAIFGYSKQVELLARKGEGAWTAETIYDDAEQGHWITAAELDGRNATDELVCSGFGGRISLLARKPGYGLPGIPAMREGATAEGTKRETAALLPLHERAPRLAAKGAAIASTKLSPLCYQGGFETKSLVYETLVRRDEQGRLAPRLAESWTIEEGGRRYVFTLREGARFHDDTPVTAEAVRMHFRRWVGLTEHGWLLCNERIVDVQALDERRVAVELDRPHALLEDLCAINPCAIRGPGSLDKEGEHVRAIGSGPFRFVGVAEEGRVLRYERFDAHPQAAELPPRIDLVRLEKDASDDPLAALERGEVDLVLSSWLVRVDAARVREIERDPRFRVASGPGSCVIALAFELESGPCRDLGLRRRIAAAIDRDELVRELEHGLADATTVWAAPSIAFWPRGNAARAREAGAPSALALARPQRIAPARAGYMPAELPARFAAQLVRAGIPAEVLSADAPAGAGADLRFDITHGAPYDPWTTLMSRFGPRPRGTTAETSKRRSSTPKLEALVALALEIADEGQREALYAEIQAELDASLPLVPLYAPRRVAITRAELSLPRALTHDMYGVDLRFLGAVGAAPLTAR